MRFPRRGLTAPVAVFVQPGPKTARSLAKGTVDGITGISEWGSLRSRRWRHRRVRVSERVRARTGASRTSTGSSSRYPTQSNAPGIRTGRMRLGRTRTVGNAPNGASRIIAGNVGSFWTGRIRTGSTRSDTTGPKFPRLKPYGFRLGFDRVKILTRSNPSAVRLRSVPVPGPPVRERAPGR